MKKENNKIKSEWEWKSILFNIFILMFSVTIIALFHEKVILTTILLIVLSAIALIKWKSWIAFFVFIISSIIGTFCEIILVNKGAWTYSVQTIFNIPLWLFILWGIAGAGLSKLALKFKRLGVKK